MGSAAAYHLTKASQRVLGLDRFAPPHKFGSSHGQTRIIREAYFEHPLYVPLVQRAYDLWAELEQSYGRQLLLQTGGLMIGPPEGTVFSGAKRSAEQHRLTHEILTAAEVRRRFPALQPDDRMKAVWENRAGILFPEACIEAHLSLARRHGAQLHFEEMALRWEREGRGIRVITDKGSYGAARLVLTAGAWLSSLVPELRLPLQIERQVLFWFAACSDRSMFKPERCPIHLWEYETDRFFYGFPDLGTGVKVARHHEGEPTGPDKVRREVSEDEVQSMRRLLHRFIPGAAGEPIDATVCLYTNTPDHHFLIAPHPADPEVLIASPCSGHGFKFASVIGEVVTEWICRGCSRFDLSLFGFRFDQ